MVTAMPVTNTIHKTLNERCFIQLTTHHLPDKLLQDMEVQKK